MAMAEPTSTSLDCLNIDFMRNLVKQYSELGQWTSALFWADAAAAAGNGNGTASGDDIWLLASVMLARGELHRAAHAVTSRGLHRRHLLCLGVAMRAYLAAREPSTALTMMEECDPALLEPRNTDQTHNRALASVLVWQARALWALERREAGAAALCAALRADCACYEALDLLLDRHALTPAQGMTQARALWALERREAGAAALCAALRADCACYEALDLLLDRHALTPAQGMTQARALWALERREAGAAALCAALRADCACYEALDLLLDRHALTPAQGMTQARALWALERREAGAAALRADCACYEALDLLLDRHALTPAQGMTQARALWALERREAGAAALCAALRADCACYEALDLLLDRHALTPAQESELVESLSVHSQLSAAEATLVRAAYRERLNRYQRDTGVSEPDCPLTSEVEHIRTRTSEAAICRARRLAAGCEWAAALKLLDSVDPWCCGEVRAACLVELRKSSELFAFAHTLVDAYPNSWMSWFAVGCYYYLIGKSEFARRYLSKAKSLEPGAGCAWLAYGHSFAADNEHDQAMAAYFKASQLMGGCHLPPLYVGVECSLLNNATMCERFLWRAHKLHDNQEPALDKMVERSENGGSACWERLVPVVASPHVAHEAGAAALAAGDLAAAHDLFIRALDTAKGDDDIAQLNPCWAATLDALGHTSRRLARPAAAAAWHRRALALRPARAATLAALGLALALLAREADAAAALHAALARDPDNVVALALLDAIVDRLDMPLEKEEIPQFPFPTVNISVRSAGSPPAPAPAAPSGDHTHHSDMSMSFD